MTQAPDDERHREVLRPYQPVDDAVLAELAAGSALVTESVANGVTVWPETAPEQLAAWNKLLTVPSTDAEADHELWLATAQLVYSLGRDPMPAGLPALLVATATEEEAADLLWMTQNLTELVGSITEGWIRAGMLGGGRRTGGRPDRRPDSRMCTNFSTGWAISCPKRRNPGARSCSPWWTRCAPARSSG